MDSAKRKELKNAYREQNIVGGVYSIACSRAQQVWLKSTKNLVGQQNKFEFALSVNACPEPCMRAAWEQYGGAAFSLTVLESLQKGVTQTEQEFSEDLALLLKIWQDKLTQKA